ncbi:MAG: S8 family serine peptidase [Flavobacterium sp.]|jgi:subtilisin-like proprotein convertase family protein
MKKTYYNLKTIALTLFFSLSFSINYSQTKEDVVKITSEYDLKKGQLLYEKVKKREQLDKLKAIEFAKANNLPVFKQNEDGTFDELMYLLPSGEPIYYALDNSNAATSTRVNFLRSGGGLGLNLTGTGMVPRVWDGGPINATHQEYNGRTAFGDGQTVTNTNSFHAIHVTGTVIASGVQTNARGMAYQATARTFDWNDDESEAITEAMNGMLLSNHSYGIPIANAPGNWFMGAYSTEAYNWDVIAYNFPFYLPVMSAGNDGGTNNPQPTTAGYDKLNGNKNAKNILTVANGTDATVNATTGAITAFGTINGSSSQGPSDDRRIKPDITGNGTTLYSTGSGSGTGGGNTSYSTLSGTSMAAPNVTGTLTLIQQHYNNTNGKFMKAATLKGLACHTATDRGRTGPDAQYGWGYLDAKTSAETISNNGLTSWISEETLNQGQTFTMQVVATGGGTPLLGSITWTDVPDASKINSGTLNETTPDLTNDLDIRITQGASTFYPWRLQSSATANATRTGDNDVDNVERINIDAPTAGAVYTITVTHKGTLADGPQKFALVVTGVTSNFTFKSTADTKTVCSSSGSVVYDFALTKIGGPNVNLSAQNIPAGANVVISPTSMSASGNFTVTVSNLSAVSAGTYEIDIVGNNGSEIETRKATLTVFHDNFTSYPQTTLLPADGSLTVSTSPNFTWSENANAENYNLQVATSPTFSTTVINTTTSLTEYQATGLNAETVYYWRVIPSNRCATGNSSASKSFQTGTINCAYNYTNGTNVAISNTADNSGIGMGNGWSISTINVPDSFIIGDTNMDLLLNHTYIQDMTMYLEAPNGNYIILAQEACGDNDNINAKFIDSGIAPVCTAAVPALTGNIKPFEPLSDFQNLNSNGNWLLYVNDPYAGDDGIIDSWTLNLCSLSAIGNLPSLVNNGITVLNNSTHNIANTEVDATTAAQTAAQQTYTLVSTPTVGNIRRNTTILSVGNTFTQDEINTGIINYINAELSANTTSFKVDIKNSTNGWLANQLININIVECGDISTTWNGVSWSNGAPNKVKEIIFAGNYNSSTNIEACSAIINTGINVTFNPGNTLIVDGTITVNGTGLLTIENNGGLRQLNDSAINTGNILVKRNSAPMIRQDYTAWSSPTSGQQLQAFSPNTLANRFYQYLYTGTTTPTAYQAVASTANFVAGKGYMIRSADNSSPTVPTAHNGQFTGVPNNGIITQSVGIGYNLLGNPYASPMNGNTFLANNPSVGTLYFWTHTIPASGGVYPVNNFAAYTTLGGTAAAAGGATPNGFIQTGQGFYVQASVAGNTTFNNAQRVNASTSTQFFRTSEENVEVEKHRIWLNLNDSNNNYNQILVGYMDGATNAVDNMIDGLILDDSNSIIYSIINSDKYVIQGKSLPFTDEDIIPLGINASTTGVYNISLENTDGLFTVQDVFLKDKYTNIIHDIKQSEYQFSTQDGIFEDRFEIVFKSSVLSHEDFANNNNNNVLVYTQNNQIEINSSKENITSVKMFDVLGRTIFNTENLGVKELTIVSLNTNNQALFIKVTLATGEIITKKVIF